MTTALRQLVPDSENVPSKERWKELADCLGEECGVPVDEVSYTWRNGQPSLTLSMGYRDNCRATGKGTIQMMTDEESGYPCVVYLPQGCDLQESGKKWPLVFFFHGKLYHCHTSNSFFLVLAGAFFGAWACLVSDSCLRIEARGLRTSLSRFSSLPITAYRPCRSFIPVKHRDL